LSDSLAESFSLCSVHLSDCGLRNDPDFLHEILDKFGIISDDHIIKKDCRANYLVDDPDVLQEIIRKNTGELKAEQVSK